MAKLTQSKNPLVGGQVVQSVDIERLQSPVILGRARPSGKREIRDARRRKTATNAIEGLTRNLTITGFTKGQFSLLDLLMACIEITGPVSLVLSTWTAARREIQALTDLQARGDLLSARFLLDFTMVRRDPEAANAIRDSFGCESIRIAQNHSKFALFENNSWNLVLRTSMNLNMNPRFEDFTIAHDPELMAFFNAIVNEIWAKQPSSLTDERPKEIKRHFREKM